ncbi:MAG: hypothetical protein PVI31_13120 [Gemmatimonadota bacterium]|jgi:hypothetical protein
MPHTTTIRPGAGGAHRRLATGGLILVASLPLLSGCELPSDLPEWETRWVVPAEETRFGVGELLPGEVTISPDSATFIVDFDPVSFAQSLGDLCTLCGPAHGSTVPKPPFIGTAEDQVDFPAEVYAISVVSGQVALEMDNDLGFDPLRPGVGVTGTMTLQVTDDADGDVLSELVIDGVDTPFPSGSTLTRNLSLAQMDVNGSLVASVVVNSPLGDPVAIDTTAAFSVVATPSNIRVASVAVDVSDESVNFDTVDLGVEDVDQEVRDAVQEGAFVLDVTNPFGVSADFDLEITGTDLTPIQRSATLTGAAMETIRLDFYGSEIRDFLGKENVQLTGSAIVDSGAGIVTVMPGQELVLKASLDVTMTVGAGD